MAGLRPARRRRRGARRGAWPTISASAEAAVPGWPVPHALTREEIAEVTEQFVAAARRARRRLRHDRAALRPRLPAERLPVADLQQTRRRVRRRPRRPDAAAAGDRRAAARRVAGGAAAARARLGRRRRSRQRHHRRRHPSPSRASWPPAASTWSTARPAASAARYAHPEHYGYQVPYAARVRAEAGVATMAVGLVVDPARAGDRRRRRGRPRRARPHRPRRSQLAAARAAGARAPSRRRSPSATGRCRRAGPSRAVTRCCGQLGPWAGGPPPRSSRKRSDVR